MIWLTTNVVHFLPKHVLNIKDLMAPIVFLRVDSRVQAIVDSEYIDFFIGLIYGIWCKAVNNLHKFWTFQCCVTGILVYHFLELFFLPVELRRKISDAHQAKISLKKVAAPKGVELEREILEAEYAFVTDKVGRLQDKVRVFHYIIAKLWFFIFHILP